MQINGTVNIYTRTYAEDQSKFAKLFHMRLVRWPTGGVQPDPTDVFSSDPEKFGLFTEVFIACCHVCANCACVQAPRDIAM